MTRPAPAVATAAVAALAAVPALAALRNGFVYDDVPVILENPLVHGLARSGEIWTSSYWPTGTLYRPVTSQLFALEWAGGGGRPLLFHATSLLLTILVAVLVLRLLRRVLAASEARPDGPELFVASLLAAALFAVHPVHVEAVANVVGQAELLATLFTVLAAERYLAWRSSAGQLSQSQRLLLAGLTLLAMLAKETGVVVPLLLAAAELGLLGRSRARLVATYVLQGCAVALALLLRWSVLGSIAGEHAARVFHGLGPVGRGVAMLPVIPQWARLLLWPVHLQAEYGPPALPVSAQLSAAHWLGVLLLGLSVALWIWSRRRARVIGFGLLWIVLALGPVSNLVTPTGIVLAERVMLLPSVGVAIALAGALLLLVRRLEAAPRWMRVAAASTAVLLLGLALVRSVGRTATWRSQDAFFDRLPRDAPRTYRAHFVTSRYYYGKSRFPEAELAARRALTLYPDDPRVHEQLGQILRVEGRCGEALPVLDAGLQLEPDGTTLRSRLIECALATGDTVRARAVARAGVDRGLKEFEATLRRLGR